MKYIQKVIVKIEKYGRINIESKVASPKDFAKIIYKYLENSDREYLGVACLNTKNNIINISTVSIGTLNSSLFHPREVFKVAIASNANSIIMFHNHPSGDITPSQADYEMSNRIKESGKILGIEMLDNIIIGSEPINGFTSFKQKGLI